MEFSLLKDAYEICYIKDSGDKSRLLVVGDTVAIKNGKNGEHYSWGRSLYYVVNENSAHEIQGSLGIRNLNYRKKEHSEQELILLNSLKTNNSNGTTDLFITNENKEIRLSDFIVISEGFNGEIDMSALEGMLASYIIRSVDFSPDASKLIFNYPLVIYDLVHGPTCIVNLDGKNLKVLINDGCPFRESKPVWLPDGTSILFIKHGDNGKQNLYMTINRENDLRIIDTGVDYFMLR